MTEDNQHYTRHQVTQREQRLFQADQEQCQSDQYVPETDEYPFQVGDILSQHEQLETDDDAGNRQHVGQRRTADLQQVQQDFHQSITMP